MSDTKEKDDAPQIFPVDTAVDGNRPTPDAAVSVPQLTEQPKTKELHGDGSAPPVVVKQDVSEGEIVDPMEIDTKATADGIKIGAGAGAEMGAGEKVAETETETYTPAEAVVGCKISNVLVTSGQGSVQDAGTAEKQEEIKSQPQVSSGAQSLDVQSVPDDKVAQPKIESVGMQSVPDEKVAQIDSATVKSIPDDKVAQIESSAAQSVPDVKVTKIESAAVQSLPDDKAAQIESSAVLSGPNETVVKNFITASETLVEPLEPASDTVTAGSTMRVETAEPSADTKPDVLPVSEIKSDADGGVVPAVRDENIVLHSGTPEVKAANGELGEDVKNQLTAVGEGPETNVHGMIMSTPVDNQSSLSKLSFLLDDDDVNEAGTEDDQAAFMKELENFFREKNMEFKPPKFYGEGLNCLKLWRAVMRLGGYDKVTSCKLWRQVGESFRPPKTCTTVSWTFRGFYEKALLDYERHKVRGGELALPIASQSEPAIEHQGSGSGRARRDAAARAMQGWHSQRLLGNGVVSDPVIKDKTPVSLQKHEKQLRNIGLLKRKRPSYVDSDVKLPRAKASKAQLNISVGNIGPPADWVKINVQRTEDCYEVYALVPGLLREEVRVQSDPAGRLVISGEPEHPDNPWGVTPFKKVINLPSRIDPHQTSAVVTLHGQLFVRVPVEQSE